MKMTRNAIRLATASALSLCALPVFAQDVAVITPYLAQPGTQFYVDAFTARADELGWTVNTIDTAGDVAAVISRIEDAVIQGYDAIVINVDPSQVGAGLQVAADAGIPVVGMDAGTDPLVAVNVTSDGVEMAGITVNYVLEAIEGEGNVVMFTFDPFPPVAMRGAEADRLFAEAEGVEVLARITPDVADGGIADARAQMEAVLSANPEAGSIKAVWAAWDQPALGALQAIEAAGREGEGIVITGIDANPQARDAVATGGNFKATVAQDFAGIGTAAADAVAAILGGETPAANVVYVPTQLITADNATE